MKVSLGLKLGVMINDIKIRFRPINTRQTPKDIFRNGSDSLRETAHRVAEKTSETLKTLRKGSGVYDELKEINDYYLAIEAKGGEVTIPWVRKEHRFNEMEIIKPFLDLLAKYGNTEEMI